MDTFETIFTRRSVREFTDKPVKDETINKLLEAAMYAPSATNSQPWHFIVVKDKNMLQKIAAEIKSAQPCDEANIVIIPCADLSLEYKNNWPLDTAAATQNILLAARALKLGAVWCGIYPNPDKAAIISKLFKLPQNIAPLCVIPIGYTDIKQEDVKRFQPDRIHYEVW